MIVLVCGGRNFTDKRCVYEHLDARFKMISKIVEGGATGADTLARTWAKERGVPCTTRKALWALYGKAAGRIRNILMLREERPDLVLAFPGGRGTEDMIRQAEKAGVRVEKVGWYET